jgi:hypothetical protein
MHITLGIDTMLSLKGRTNVARLVDHTRGDVPVVRSADIISLRSRIRVCKPQYINHCLIVKFILRGIVH